MGMEITHTPRRIRVCAPSGALIEASAGGYADGNLPVLASHPHNGDTVWRFACWADATEAAEVARGIDGVVGVIAKAEAKS